jgi:hypothetical protein
MMELAVLLDETPESWEPFRQSAQEMQWRLDVDGLVYVHQYAKQDAARLAQRQRELGVEVAKLITPQDTAYFSRGPSLNRLRLRSYPELVDLFG